MDFSKAPKPARAEVSSVRFFTLRITQTLSTANLFSIALRLNLFPFKWAKNRFNENSKNNSLALDACPCKLGWFGAFFS